jgi:hypothetical protein
MNIRQAKELIRRLYLKQIETGERFTVELESGPGLGKSEMVDQLATELGDYLGKPFANHDFFLNSKEAPDIGGFGLPADDEDGSKIMLYTKAPWMPRAGDPQHGFVFLDEFRQSQHDVQKPSAELLLKGRVNESWLPITYMVLAASNREKDRSGVQRELMFVSNRRMLIKITPDLDSWVDWAERKGDIHWIAIAFAKHRPGLVFQDDVPEQSGPFCTPRSFVKMQYLIDDLPEDLFTEAAAGYVGEGVAAEFCSFMRVVDEIADFDEIVASPGTARLPKSDRPDAQFATMQMIAHRVDAETATPAFEYLKRMPEEFQVAGLRATLKRQPQVLNNKDFASWVKDNKKLIVNANLMANM